MSRTLSHKQNTCKLQQNNRKGRTPSKICKTTAEMSRKKLK